ncbi:hypothetical protein ACOCJ7_02405 [Knoellia sp. CPCC 206453]
MVNSAGRPGGGFADWFGGGGGDIGDLAAVCEELAAAGCPLLVDRAVQTHGGNGLAAEYGLVDMIAGSRLSRIAPVSREMVLNFIAQFSLGLPKSY